jgi:hypothetical protein
MVERLALASQEALTPVALLQQICAEIAGGFAFDRVVVTAYEPESHRDSAAPRRAAKIAESRHWRGRPTVRLYAQPVSTRQDRQHRLQRAA